MTTVLWADDEIDLLRPHILFLEEKGYRVVPVTSGTDALDMLTDNIDLVFLDEQMPGLSGIDTLKVFGASRGYGARIYEVSERFRQATIDTLKVVEGGVVAGTPDRNVFWNAQTPQVFRSGILRRAHAAALSDGFVGTDDSSLIERLGGRVKVVTSDYQNIKVTTPEDLSVAETFLRG